MVRTSVGALGRRSGLAGAEVPLADGTTVVADTAYLIRSIVDPGAELVADYNLRMPANNLSDAEIADIVAYIETLADCWVSWRRLPPCNLTESIARSTLAGLAVVAALVLLWPREADGDSAEPTTPSVTAGTTTDDAGARELAGDRARPGARRRCHDRAIAHRTRNQPPSSERSPAGSSRCTSATRTALMCA